MHPASPSLTTTRGMAFGATVLGATVSATLSVLFSTGLAASLAVCPTPAKAQSPAQAVAQAPAQAPAPAARQAGLMFTSVPAAGPDRAAIPVALFYPTAAASRAMPMGPFSPQVAMQAAPDAQVKGLIVLSHGTGGSELGHTSLAEALARAGYLLAALRHPGDNWQDRSLLIRTPERYFDERPRQASRVIDFLLAHPQWQDRIARDARGPRVGVLGHSAGGYTALALAGGQADPAQAVRHCGLHGAEDPIFCSLVRTPTASNAPISASVADARVRAVVAMAPVGAVFTATSLADIRIPVRVYQADGDRFLVPRFHAQWIARHAPAVELRQVPGAMHFAFMDTPSMPIPSEDGDVGADAPGFDRAGFLRQLAQALPAFFDQAW